MTENSVLQKQYLTFLIAGDEYAVPVLRVKEILEYETVTRVPRTPHWIRGVFNLRGSVVRVVDLAAKFGISETKVARTTCVVIVEVEVLHETIVMGVIVDAVSQVIDMAASNIEPVPAFGTQVHLDYLQGMVTMGKRFALLLDIDRVLNADELLRVKTVESGNNSDVVDSSISSASPVAAVATAFSNSTEA